MNLLASRLAWLILVNDGQLIHTKTPQGFAVWSIEGHQFGSGRPSEDLWWLWSAEYIRFTRPEYPTAVIATQAGVQALIKAGVIEGPDTKTARVTIPQKGAVCFTDTTQGELVTMHEEHWSRVMAAPDGGTLVHPEGWTPSENKNSGVSGA